MTGTLPFYLAGEPTTSDLTWDIHNPYDGSLVGRVAVASRAQVQQAVDAAAEAAPEARAMPAHRRARVLMEAREALAGRKDDLVRLLSAEAGKPITAARAEVERLLFTLQDGAEEAKRIDGELRPLDAAPAGAGRLGLVRRFPLSPIAAITPFNFPLNLAAHKLAPAIACGASIVLKPPPQDPLSSMLLAEALAGAGYPAGAISILPCEVDDAAPMLDDPRVRMISFTGSAKVGWAIRERAARKKVALELGGNAAVIVAPDADLDAAVRRSTIGAFSYAGQSCISVQRLLVHHDVYDAFVKALVERTAALTVGDPLDEQTDVGPMIDEANARRAEQWVSEAVDGGATVATGGTRAGAVYAPTVLLGTSREMKVNSHEVFAPVVTVRPYDDFQRALDEVNASEFGLQAGLFTNDMRLIRRAWEQLDVGGLIVNDISSFRVDQMPYGGVKQSGLGREGVRYAIEEMTEPRLLVL